MRKFSLLLIAVIAFVFSFSLNAQTVIVEFMKLKPGMGQSYLEIEKDWKKIHEKRIEEGLINGWQLWRKLYSAEDDPYQYITVTWYDNLPQTSLAYPDDFAEGLMTDDEVNALFDKTSASRVLSRTEVYHRASEAENSRGSRYIVINRMRVKPGKQSDYINYEIDTWKPLHDAYIEAGSRENWGLWQAYPYSKGQPRFITVDGFKSLNQMWAGNADVLESVHPGMTWADIDKKGSGLRDMVSTEIWESVDYVFKEE